MQERKVSRIFFLFEMQCARMRYGTPKKDCLFFKLDFEKCWHLFIQNLQICMAKSNGFPDLQLILFTTNM